MGKVRSELKNGIAIVSWTEDRLMGDPDGEQLREEVGRAIGQGVEKIVVDISPVKWSNSSGLGILISAWVMAKESGGELTVVIGSDRINSLFGVTNLNVIMKTFTSLDDAISGFEG